MLHGGYVYRDVIRSKDNLRLDSVFALERYEPLSQFLKSNARISFLQRVGWNSRLRALVELLASPTSENNQLKSRDNSRPAFAAVVIPKVSAICFCCGQCQCWTVLHESIAEQTPPQRIAFQVNLSRTDSSIGWLLTSGDLVDSRGAEKGVSQTRFTSTLRP